MPILKTTGNRVYEPLDEAEKPEVFESLKDVYDKPTFPETIAAGFRKENSLVSAGVNLMSISGNFKPIDGYDALDKNVDDIKGYELFADEFSRSQSPEETSNIKVRIDQEFKDRQTLDEAGPLGFAAQMAAGVTDPIYLMLMGTGLGAWGAGKTILKTAGKASVVGGVSEIISESAKHSSQKTRTLEESMLNVGGATILSGILGGGLHGVSKTKFIKSAKAIDEVMSDAKPKVHINGNIKESQNVFELVNAAKIEQFNVSPLVRTATSPLEDTNRIASEMMETPLVTKGNVEGISTTPQGGSVETRIKSHDAPLAESLSFLDTAYTKYRQGKGQINRLINDYALRNRGSKLSFAEFRAAIGKTMRRGDTSDIPEVQKVAESFRKKVFDPLKDKAIELKMLHKDIQVETALSYLSRVYKTKKIIAKRPEWDTIVRNWLKSERAKAAIEDPGGKRSLRSDAEVDDIVDSITNNILGSTSGRIPYEGISKADPLKGRVFMIPDEMIEDFLESDIEIIARQYSRTMAPDVELTDMFGNISMTEPMEKIVKGWDQKIKKAKTEKQRVKAQKRKEADIRDIEAMRDRLRGTYRMPKDPNSFFVRAGRALRDINFLRMLGGMTISAIPDIARPIAVNGLKPVAKGLMGLATSPKRFNLARLEAKKAAVGLDMVLNSRAASMAEISDIYARGTTFERGLRKASDSFAKITLMSPWNASMKQFSGVVTADRFLDDAISFSKGTLSKNATRRMTQAGIDKKSATKIALQYVKYGDDGTIKLSNGHLWDDKDALKTFRNAVLKDVDRTIVTPGKGELPLWSSSEVGKLVIQFKSFAASAHHKIMLADLQHGDTTALNGFLLSVALGSVVYGLKNYVAGRDIPTDPLKVVVESLDRSGGFGYFWDVNNIVEKASRGNIGVSPLMGAPPMSRYISRNIVGALAGPSLGTAEDIIQLGGAAASKEFTQSDLRRLRKMMPGQNLFYMRRLLNNLEEDIGRGLSK